MNFKALPIEDPSRKIYSDFTELHDRGINCFRNRMSESGAYGQRH
jgi:hypothetical protein